MDFNQAFHAYDTMEGANALSLFRAGVTQQEAAAEAVRAIGLNQIKEIPEDIFVSLPQYREMFLRRLEWLKTMRSDTSTNPVKSRHSAFQ